MKMSKKGIKHLKDVLESDLIGGMKKYKIVEELDSIGVHVNMDCADLDRDTLAIIFCICASHIVDKHTGEGGEIVATVQRKLSDVGPSLSW